MKKLWLAILTALIFNQVSGQKNSEGKFYIDDTGAHYIKVSFVPQFWHRKGLLQKGAFILKYQIAYKNQHLI